jgi:hypothetical protein
MIFKTTLTFTPEDNVRYGKVVDPKQVIKLVNREPSELVTVFDLPSGMLDTVPLNKLSSFRHRLMIDNVKHFVLSSISKST